MRLAGLVFVASVVPALAEDLPYPPAEFSFFATWAPIAIEVSEQCDDIELDPVEYPKRYSSAVKALQDVGIVPEKWREQTRGIQPGIRDRPRMEFFLAYGVNNDSTSEDWCIAGNAALDNAPTSALGSLLQKVD